MNRTLRNGTMLALALALAATPSAWAACTFESQPLWNGLILPITGCADTNPVTGYAYSIAAPTANSAGQAFVCNEAGVINGIGLPCQFEAGTPGDTAITVYYEWGSGNAGSAGCPNADRAGDDAVALQIVDNNGAGLLLSVGFEPISQQYIVETAFNGDGTATCGFQNGPILVSSTAGPTPSANNVCVNVPAPTMYSDCDPTSLGGGQTCTTPGARPPINRGRLYSLVAPCGSSPNPRLASGWTLLPAQPDAAGDACNLIDRPTTVGDCAFVGATATWNVTETLGVLSSLQVAGAAAATDKVKIDSAGFQQGKVVVAFSTSNETTIVGFNVYSGSTKLNGSMITARGSGSNPYNFEVGRGALKGGKSVHVEAVKSDGSVEKSAAVSLK